MNAAMTPSLSDDSQAPEARQFVIHPTRAGMRTANGVARPAPRPSDRTLTDPAEILDALTASRQLLDAAQREVQGLHRRIALLREQVTVLRQAARTARQFAYRDALTGLPNRRLLVDRFNQVAAQCDRQHKELAVLFLDLDGFKNINDRFGHAAGDNLLKSLAARLAACLRISDTACRYGGDEFVVLLPEIESAQAATVVSENILRQLSLPYSVAGTDIQLTASIGMAVYPVDGKSYGELMRASDCRMYRSKLCSRNGVGGAEPQNPQGETP